MNKEELEAFAREAEKTIKKEKDPSEFNVTGKWPSPAEPLQN
jgi:hypothetical protein